MLSKQIVNALRGYTETMQRPVSLVLQTGEHEKRAELREFLAAIADVSEKLTFEERDSTGLLRSPVSFLLEADGVDTGIRFSGIPGGHEFNSLILAILQASGTELKLDKSLQKLVANITEQLRFEIVISLSCHNCPDVVQALNQLALLNAGIEAEMIDGGLFPELIEKREIQGVPSVWLNGELFGNGKIDVSGLIEKLIQRDPSVASRKGDIPDLPVQDVTVVGAGPAGISAAIYSARKGLAVTVIGDRFGGQVKDTMGIENLISVPQTTGPELVDALKTHVANYDVTLREHLRVDKVEGGELKTLTLSSGEQIRTRALIIATGARWRELGVPGERENVGSGVAYCPHCDGPFFKGKDVAVIGGGNSGIEAALDLSGIVRSVTVYELLPELKADKVLVDKARERENITLLTNVATREISARDGRVDAIVYQDRSNGELRSQSVAGVFVQIGLVPNSQFVSDRIELSPSGEIVIDEKCRTSEPGVFACGDVTTVPYKQIVVAMGEGSTAALGAFEYLLTRATGDDPIADAA